MGKRIQETGDRIQEERRQETGVKDSWKNGGDGEKKKLISY
jgi:hypothetical protein